MEFGLRYGRIMQMQCPMCNDAAFLNLQLYDDRYGFEGLFDVYQCQSCLHTFVDTTFTDDQISNLYTAYYPRLSITEVVAPRLRGFRSWLDNGNSYACQYVLPDTKVLDIGCGAGEKLMYLKTIGCDAIGIDADKNVLPLAEKYNLDIRIGVFDKDLFEKESFDYVLMDQVMEHIKDPIHTLRDVKTLLKPSGKIIFSTPWIWGAGRRLWGRKWAHWHIPYHVTFFSNQSLEIAAQATGLNLERVMQRTSSTWIYTQWRHLFFLPKQNQPSYLWGQHRKVGEISLCKKIIRILLAVWHKSRIDHFITRFLDIAGWGDNIVVIMSPKREINR
jgi:2-polyprenyl-3-methyl-5-hydroxy-6-metoxy-1,4-benzoquinol methylase